MFKLAITRSSSSPIVDEISTSASADMDFTTSTYQMRTRILKILTTMFDKNDNHSAVAQDTYKGYADRKRRHTADFFTKEKLSF